MRINATTPTIGHETLEFPIAQLKSFRLQNEIVFDLPEIEFAELVDDIRVNGVKTPISIMPDGTTIDGHQRIRACRELGILTIRCVVRHDLVDDPLEQESEFIKQNLVRRQMSKLDQARCAKHLIDLDRRRDNEVRHDCRLMRDRVGQLMGVSGRSAARWLKALELPLKLQRATEQGRLKLTNAERLAKLGTEEWDLAIESVECGENPNDLVEMMIKAAQGSERPTKVYSTLESLERVIQNIEEMLEEYGRNVASEAAYEAMQRIHVLAVEISTKTNCWSHDDDQEAN